MRVLLFGTFDRLHPGHEFVLREAAQRGEVHVVIARDANVRKIKGRDPEQNEENRKTAIESTYPQAHVLLGDDTDFLAPVRSVSPDLILLGYDQMLPPGVREADLPCPVERLPAFQPAIYKSSVRRA
ncbi:MAG: FAD synthetase [Candidatus Peregrinibacteria bacterium Greene0416_19]|nr:MAG: FAD synthetase [Candidatus Peregrinibacteria bacterium Greene0416_19]